MHESLSRFIRRSINLIFVRPWDLTATIGWSLVIGSVFIGVQTGIVSLYFNFWEDPSAYDSAAARMASVQANGILISIMTLAAAIVCSSLVFLLVRRSGIGVRQYLALKPVGILQLIGWMAILIVLSLLSSLVASYLEQDVVTDFTRNLYDNAGNIYLLAVAIVLAAPFFEELFFRGFMFYGLSRSRFGVVSAILITALIWTVIHGQYDWYVRSNIFVIGVLFGIARYKSGSILPPLFMHMLMNALALVEVANL